MGWASNPPTPGFDEPGSVLTLLDSLCDANVEEQFSALTNRAATDLTLDDPDSLAGEAAADLLGFLRDAGADAAPAELWDGKIWTNVAVSCRYVIWPAWRRAADHVNERKRAQIADYLPLRYPVNF